MCGTAVNTRQCFHRTTILAAVAFLDAFQKVADMATNSRGEFVFLSCSFFFNPRGASLKC